MHAVLALGRFLSWLQQVQALQDAFFLTRLQTGVRVVLVHQGDVEEHVFLLLDHTLQAIMDDDGDFMREGRVVGNAIRNGRSQHMAVAIFMLQTFAVQGGAAGGTAQQETA